MRIAQLATNVERVPPHGYGGTEVVVDLLTNALCKSGHQVTLFASGDSDTQARLISVVETALRTNPDFPQRQWQAFDIRTLLKLKEMASEFDIVHNHMGWQALPFLATLGLPVITTNHNPVKQYNLPIYEAYKDLPYVAISNAYRRLNYPDIINYVATIYNGVDLELYKTTRGAGKYLLFLGRICHDKGTREAIAIATQLGLPLKIAGKLDEPDKPYFEDYVKPKLSKQIEYVGEVDQEEKLKLFTEAIATIHAINFEEPFGLVMVESLACGVPLLALRRGSVPELLTDPETAVIGDTIDDLVTRFGQIEQVKWQDCRKRVQDNFSKEAMVDNYLKAYQAVIRSFENTKTKAQYAQT
jgi:glycosyltransferase involved in cell wall biosynthesis